MWKYSNLEHRQCLAASPKGRSYLQMFEIISIGEPLYARAALQQRTLLPLPVPPPGRLHVDDRGTAGLIPSPPYLVLYPRPRTRGRGQGEGDSPISNTRRSTRSTALNSQRL